MIATSNAQTRLCPHCANSVGDDTANCPYCKADLSSQPVPPWLNRDEPLSEPRVVWQGMKMPIPSKFIWPSAVLVVALIAFFTGRYVQRNEQLLSSQADSKQLQAKDQMIQSQEAQLTQTRQQLNDNSNQLAEIKTKLEESQKELSATKQRLGAATRETARLTAGRSATATRTASRAPDAGMSLPGSAARRTRRRRRAAPAARSSSGRTRRPHLPARSWRPAARSAATAALPKCPDICAGLRGRT